MITKTSLYSGFSKSICRPQLCHSWRLYHRRLNAAYKKAPTQWWLFLCASNDCGLSFIVSFVHAAEIYFIYELRRRMGSQPWDIASAKTHDFRS